MGGSQTSEETQRSPGPAQPTTHTAYTTHSLPCISDKLSFGCCVRTQREGPGGLEDEQHKLALGKVINEVCLHGSQIPNSTPFLLCRKSPHFFICLVPTYILVGEPSSKDN